MVERKKDVITDVELMVGLVWAPEIAAKLGYTEAHNLGQALRKWGRPDLAKYFIKANYDGLTTASHSTRWDSRQSGAA